MYFPLALYNNFLKQVIEFHYRDDKRKPNKSKNVYMVHVANWHCRRLNCYKGHFD